jgi:hypothetical protein
MTPSADIAVWSDTWRLAGHWERFLGLGHLVMLTSNRRTGRSVRAAPRGVKPNFFILGAPKCGTTAMAVYLGDHPEVLMSDPKEPAFWASDYPGARRSQAVPMETLSDYESLFKARTDQHRVVGEATALYLSSQCAVEAILDYNAESRFLVMVRNPIAFAAAFHHEMLFRMREDVEDFGTAWRLRHERAVGRSIPRACDEPRMLDYHRMGLFGAQLNRAQSVISHDRLKIVFLEDLKANPRDVYAETLSFLDLPEDGRREFPVLNRRKAARSRLLNRIYFANRGPLGAVVKRGRRCGKRLAPLRAMWSRLQYKPRPTAPLPAGLHEELRNAFQEDVGLLAELTERDLNHWLVESSN